MTVLARFVPLPFFRLISGSLSPGRSSGKAMRMSFKYC